MTAIPAALTALLFGGIALYALFKGYVPIRPNLRLRRDSNPVGYWLMVTLHATLAGLSATGVYLHFHR